MKRGKWRIGSGRSSEAEYRPTATEAAANPGKTLTLHASGYQAPREKSQIRELGVTSNHAAEPDEQTPRADVEAKLGRAIERAPINTRTAADVISIDPGGVYRPSKNGGAHPDRVRVQELANMASRPSE